MQLGATPYVLARARGLLVPEERLELSDLAIGGGFCSPLSTYDSAIPAGSEIIIAVHACSGVRLPAYRLNHPRSTRPAGARRKQAPHVDSEGKLRDLKFSILPSLLGPEDAVVLNDTRVHQGSALPRRQALSGGRRSRLFVERPARRARRPGPDPRQPSARRGNGNCHCERRFGKSGKAGGGPVPGAFFPQRRRRP